MASCFFIGHHDTPDSISKFLEKAVERHIDQYAVTKFIVGRYGGFDRLAARVLAEAKQRHSEIRLTLLLAYYNPQRPIDLPPGFDDSLYPDGMERIPPRAAIVRANQYMIRHSDYLIAYDAGKIGNTRKLLAFARRREERGLIHIENLADRAQGFWSSDVTVGAPTGRPPTL